MRLNKIQLKARVFELIKPLKNAGALDDVTVDSIKKNISSIEGADFEFISRILIKEADYNDYTGAVALLLIAEKISPRSFVSNVLEELKSYNVSDNQKMFFINMLSGLGLKYAVWDIGAYLKNPIEALNFETSRFMKTAEIDPSAQIDFLDFYFASSEADRNELLHSVTSHYKGGLLINLLSPLMIAADDEKLANYCLDIIEEEKSLFAVKPLEYLKYSKNRNIKQRAAKILRKMSLSGLYTNKKLNNFYKELLKDFEEPVFRISTPDGNSNFSITVSRKHKNSAYYVMFIAINALVGPFSCFGLAAITKADLDIVTERFYKNTEEIKIPPSVGRRILDELTVKRIANHKTMPYEFFCWIKLIEDISPEEGEAEEILTDGLHKIELAENEAEIISKMPFADNWFYRYSKTWSVFSEMTDKIMALGGSNLEQIEDIIKSYAANKAIKNDIGTRIIFLAFCLKFTKYKPFAQIYYSLLFDMPKFVCFIIFILKKSVYEHVLWLQLPVKSTNIFRKKEREAKDVSAYINYIEKNWIES